MRNKLVSAVGSWRFWILLIIPVAVFYFANRPELHNQLSMGQFYDFFVNSAWPTDATLLALLCAGMVGLQTRDELDKKYQPMLFSRVSIDRWAKSTFPSNLLICALLISAIWLAELLICLIFRPLNPVDIFSNMTQSPYFNLVSRNPVLAQFQFIALDFCRMLFLGAMLSGVATFGAVLFKNRYLALGFPALVTIVFSNYAFALGLRSLTWDYQMYFHVLGNFIGPAHSYIYFGSVAMIFYGLAYFGLRRRVRYE